MNFIDFFASLLIGVLTGLGVGSGGLLLVYLTLVRDFEQLTAQGMNLSFFIFAAIASAIINIRKKRIDFKLLIFVSVFGILGVMIGGFILPLISPEIIRKIFGVILIIMSLITFFFKRRNSN